MSLPCLGLGLVPALAGLPTPDTVVLHNQLEAKPAVQGSLSTSLHEWEWHRQRGLPPLLPPQPLATSPAHLHRNWAPCSRYYMHSSGQAMTHANKMHMKQSNTLHALKREDSQQLHAHSWSGLQCGMVKACICPPPLFLALQLLATSVHWCIASSAFSTHCKCWDEDCKKGHIIQIYLHCMNHSQSPNKSIRHQTIDVNKHNKYMCDVCYGHSFQ